MNNTAIRLAIKFFEELKMFPRDSQNRVKAPDSYKNKIMNEIQEVIQGGTSEIKLEEMMNKYKEEHPEPSEVYSVQDILNYLKIKAKKITIDIDPENMLEQGKFYYHPELQVAPPPPTVVQLYDGTFESSYDNDEFFLEIREKYKLENLVEYFYNIMEITDSGMKERHKGAFKHILKSNDIDVILYTIDESRAMAEDVDKPRPKNPFDIIDYIDYGMEVFNERKNTCYMEGLNRVIPRGNR
jgi:hypothetical protein